MIMRLGILKLENFVTISEREAQNIFHFLLLTSLDLNN